MSPNERFASHFGATRVLHRDDVTSGTLGVERIIDGSDPIEIAPGVRMLHSPGHTKGSAVFLVNGRYLFTGDHLAWSEARGHLYAFRSACWYSWEKQIESMKRLRELDFEWVLPGHGTSVHLEPREMKASLERCIDWMQSRSG